MKTSIDGRTVELYPFWTKHEQGEEVKPKYIPSVINFTLSSLTLGRHRLTVSAGVAVLRGEPLEVFFLDCNSTVFFSVDSTNYYPASSPSPTAFPSPSPSPEPTATPGIMLNLQSFPTTLVTASASVIAVIVWIGLFAYFRKHKR